MGWWRNEGAETVGKLGRIGALTPGTVGPGPDAVLVVEDSRAIRGLLCACLGTLKGAEVVTAATLAETRERLAGDPGRFFCAVLDLNLPDAPNGEVVDLVRGYDIPVVVLTGSVDATLRESMRRKQVVDYVIKRNAAEIEHVAYVVARIRENQSVKVLVVDDSPSFRLYLESLLRNYRYSILSAGDGRQALKLLEQHPDTSLVITDVNMPGMGGLELIESIRSRHRREDMAVIGFSDATKPGLSALLLKSGANDFLTKPFEVEEFYCRVTQNTNMIGYVRQIRDSATRDFLTGLYNRRHLFALGEPLYANARRGNIRIAAALVDADHFKRINDTFGHQVGDEALKAIARGLTSTLRDSDVVGRYGGEEFVCLALVKEERDAVPVFERVRRAVESLEVYAEGQRVAITASIGVTTDLRGSLDEMLKRADEAVYRAKETGRNRVVCL